jgi:hypothetical protein
MSPWTVAKDLREGRRKWLFAAVALALVGGLSLAVGEECSPVKGGSVGEANASEENASEEEAPSKPVWVGGKGYGDNPTRYYDCETGVVCYETIRGLSCLPASWLIPKSWERKCYPEEFTRGGDVEGTEGEGAQ